MPVSVRLVLALAAALAAGAGARAQTPTGMGVDDDDKGVVTGLVAQRVFTAPPGTELGRAIAFGERLYLTGTGGLYARRGARWDTLAPLRDAVLLAAGRGTLILSGVPPDSLLRTIVTAGAAFPIPRRIPSEALDDVPLWDAVVRGPSSPFALTAEGLLTTGHDTFWRFDGLRWQRGRIPGRGRLVQGEEVVWLLTTPTDKDAPTRVFLRENGGWRHLIDVVGLLGASPAADGGWVWTADRALALDGGRWRAFPWPERTPPAHVLPDGREAWAITDGGRLYHASLDADRPAWHFVLRTPLRYPQVIMLAAASAGDPARLYVVARDEAFAVVPGAWPGYTRATDAANLHTNDACPFFADLDGDGDLDLVTLSTQRGLDAVPTRLYSNDGQGRFSEVPLPVPPPIDVALRAARVADLDGDDRPDLALLDDRGRLLVLRNRGGLRFAAPRVAARVVSTPAPVFALRALDADRDGDLDLVAPSGAGGAWTLFANDGVGRFAARALDVSWVPGRGWRVRLAGGRALPVAPFSPLFSPAPLLDLDDDGRREQLHLTATTAGARSFSVYRLGTGGARRTGTIPAPPPGPVRQPGSSQTAVGDADLDGRADVVLDGQFALNAGGRLVWAADPFVPTVIGPAAFADVDGDGDLDLFVGYTGWRKEGRLGQLFVNGLHQNGEAPPGDTATGRRRGVRVRLRSASSNRQGVGTLVRLYDGAGLLRAEGMAGYAADDLAAGPPDVVYLAAPPDEDGPFRLEAVFPTGTRTAETFARLPDVIELRDGAGAGWALARLGWTARMNARRLPLWALGLQFLFIGGLVAAPSLARRARRLEWPAWALVLAPAAFVAAWMAAGPVTPLAGGFVPVAVGLAALAGAAALVRAVERGRGRFAHYRLFEELGRGGAGRVVRARDLVDRKEVALKLVHEHLADGTDAGQRLEREAAAAARVEHPCVVRMREAG
ncbi:MAG TPA: FG-GAP-like repeat-containing protein, partial [Rhodothermales bacterium]|nr:FG-GAP-like repeat-containing protein [Rhodothermales bacterium]